MRDTINWGFVSTGDMAAAMARAFEFQEGSRILSVCSRSAERARAFAAEHGIERHHGDMDRFLSDDEVDVVYVASTANAHFPQVMAALEAGRHVVCEKPLTLTAEQARVCRNEAESRGLFLMEAVWMRFFPLMDRLRDLLASGEIGEPRHVAADFFLDIRDSGHRLLDPEKAGGALLDLGLYPLNLARMVLGPTEDIRGHARLGDSGVDILDTMSVRATGGGSASLGCGLVGAKPMEAVLTGSDGCVKIHDIFFRPDSMTLQYGRPESEFIRMPYLGNGYPHEILHVEECLRSGLTDSPLMPMEETVDVLSLMDAFRGACGIRFPQSDESTEYRP